MVDGAMLFSFSLFFLFLPFSSWRHTNMFDGEEKKKGQFLLSLFLSQHFCHFLSCLFLSVACVCPNVTLTPGLMMTGLDCNLEFLYLFSLSFLFVLIVNQSQLQAGKS